MLSAQSIHFPPENIEELLILIDQELLVIRNIPATLSTDTMYLYLETFGQIQDFKLVPSIKDQGRQEALLLYRDPEVSKSVLERGLNGIGGFYVEKCNIKHHSYIVSKKIQIYEKSESSNALLSPIFSESGFDFEMEKQVSRRYDTSRDFTISAQKDMASQLIHGYAQLLATGYLTIEKMGERFGFFELMNRWRVLDRVKGVLNYFYVKERLTKLHQTAHIVKIQIGNQGLGKPIVDQYEQMKQIAMDMIANTKEIIEAERG